MLVSYAESNFKVSLANHGLECRICCFFLPDVIWSGFCVLFKCWSQMGGLWKRLQVRHRRMGRRFEAIFNAQAEIFVFFEPWSEYNSFKFPLMPFLQFIRASAGAINMGFRVLTESIKFDVIFIFWVLNM